MSAPAANALAPPVITMAPMPSSASKREQRLAQCVHQRVVERIELLGAVQRQEADTAPALDSRMRSSMIGAPAAFQSTLILRSLISAREACLRRPAACGTPRRPARAGSAPRSPKRCFSAGSASTLASSRLRRASTSGGVPLGAQTPNQMSSSAPLMPCSASVGASGKNGERFVLATPSSLTLPERMWGTAMPGSKEVVGVACHHVLQAPVRRRDRGCAWRRCRSAA